MGYTRILVLLLGLAAPAGAATLKVCVDVQPHPPFILPDGEGELQKLVRKAAETVEYDVHFLPAALARCRSLMRLGEVDAFLAVTYIAANETIYAFPMKQGSIDNARSVISASTAVFRKVGSKANWDGKRFTGLQSKVLIPLGVLLLEERLNAMNVKFDNGTRSYSANFDKLLAGRGELAIMTRGDGQGLLEDPRYHGKIEALPQNFTDVAYFLGLSKHYYRREPDTAEALWTAIGKLRSGRR